MASAFFRGHGKGRIHMSFQFLQLEEYRSKWTKIVAASNTFALIKKKYEFRFLLKIRWLLAMQFSTRDACCTLSCGRTVKPLFYRLHKVETVGLWVWFPFMICLGWWAGTTGPPRIPPSQGCEHLSVMPLFRKCYVPKKSQKYFEEWGKSL